MGGWGETLEIKRKELLHEITFVRCSEGLGDLLSGP